VNQEPETLETAAVSQQEQIQNSYQAGQAAIAGGEYRAAVQYLSTACALVNGNSALGGEIQLWLVTAYEAADQKQEAIALCRQLKQHPFAEIRKQSRGLLSVLEAPQLKRPPEWLTEIPDLSRVREAETKSHKGSAYASSPRPPQRADLPEPVDLSQVNTKDNAFAWLGLAVTLLTLAGWVGFGRLG
jgi:hypothetical protein